MHAKTNMPSCSNKMQLKLPSLICLAKMYPSTPMSPRHKFQQNDDQGGSACEWWVATRLQAGYWGITGRPRNAYSHLPSHTRALPHTASAIAWDPCYSHVWSPGMPNISLSRLEFIHIIQELFNWSKTYHNYWRSNSRIITEFKTTCNFATFQCFYSILIISSIILHTFPYALVFSTSRLLFY